MWREEKKNDSRLLWSHVRSRHTQIYNGCHAIPLQAKALYLQPVNTFTYDSKREKEILYRNQRLNSQRIVTPHSVVCHSKRHANLQALQMGVACECVCVDLILGFAACRSLWMKFPNELSAQKMLRNEPKRSEWNWIRWGLVGGRAEFNTQIFTCIHTYTCTQIQQSQHKNMGVHLWTRAYALTLVRKEKGTTTTTTHIHAVPGTISKAASKQTNVSAAEPAQVHLSKHSDTCHRIGVGMSAYVCIYLSVYVRRMSSYLRCQHIKAFEIIWNILFKNARSHTHTHTLTHQPVYRSSVQTWMRFEWTRKVSTKLRGKKEKSIKTRDADWQ